MIGLKQWQQDQVHRHHAMASAARVRHEHRIIPLSVDASTRLCRGWIRQTFGFQYCLGISRTHDEDKTRTLPLACGTGGAISSALLRCGMLPPPPTACSTCASFSYVPSFVRGATDLRKGSDNIGTVQELLGHAGVE